MSRFIGDNPAEHIASLFDAISLVDQCVAQLIIDDLADMQFPLEENQEKAAKRLSQAVEAMGGPNAHLVTLDRDIAHAESRSAEYGKLLDSADPDERAQARWRKSEWDAELDSLRQKRQSAHEDMLPFIAEWDKAKADLKAADEALTGLALNMADPFKGVVAQGTPAYQVWRKQSGNLVPLLLANDRDNPEFQQAVNLLEQCCLRSGYRTDNLPTNAEQLANALAELAGTPEIAPSGAEVMAQTGAVAENVKLEHSRQVIEDYRQPRPPKVTAEREWMQVQRLRETR